jgi:RNA polymerase sigma-70 factor (ECF subfamily)
MNTTSLGLLERLKRAPPGAADWRKLQDMYGPLVRSWLARVPGIGDEADDLAQEVLVVLMRELANFVRIRDGSFRAWLRQITVNRIRAYSKSLRKQPLAGLGHESELLLEQLEDPSSDLARQWDRDHDRHVFQKLQAQVQPDFEPRTWEAFVLFTLEERPAAEVSDKLGISEGSVIQAKFRILKRLREEAGELLD